MKFCLNNQGRSPMSTSDILMFTHKHEHTHICPHTCKHKYIHTERDIYIYVYVICVCMYSVEKVHFELSPFLGPVIHSTVFWQGQSYSSLAIWHHQIKKSRLCSTLCCWAMTLGKLGGFQLTIFSISGLLGHVILQVKGHLHSTFLGYVCIYACMYVCITYPF